MTTYFIQFFAVEKLRAVLWLEVRLWCAGAQQTDESEPFSKAVGQRLWWSLRTGVGSLVAAGVVAKAAPDHREPVFFSCWTLQFQKWLSELETFNYKKKPTRKTRGINKSIWRIRSEKQTKPFLVGVHRISHCALLPDQIFSDSRWRIVDGPNRL